MKLTLNSSPLPTAWDGRAVEWDRWEAPIQLFICPPPKDERCECGSTRSRFTSRGLRDPDPEFVHRLESLPKIGRRDRLMWPVYDIFAFRCPECGMVEVWDMESGQWWVLDDSDYGLSGSWA